MKKVEEDHNREVQESQEAVCELRARVSSMRVREKESTETFSNSIRIAEQEIKQTLEVHRQQEERFETSLRASADSVRVLEQQVDTLTTSMEQKDSLLALRTQEAESHTASITTLEKDRTTLTGLCDKLKGQLVAVIAEQESAAKRHAAEIEDFTAKLQHCDEASTKESQAARLEAEELAKRLAEFEQRFARLTEQMQAAADALTKKDRDLAMLKEMQTHLQAANDEHEVNAKSYDESAALITSLRGELAASEGALKDAQNDTTKLTDTLEAERATHSSNITTLQAEVATLEAKVAAETQKNSNFDVQMTEKSAECTSLQQKAVDLEAELERVQGAPQTVGVEREVVRNLEDRNEQLETAVVERDAKLAALRKDFDGQVAAYEAAQGDIAVLHRRLEEHVEKSERVEAALLGATANTLTEVSTSPQSLDDSQAISEGKMVEMASYVEELTESLRGFHATIDGLNERCTTLRDTNKGMPLPASSSTYHTPLSPTLHHTQASVSTSALSLMNAMH